MWCCAPTPLPRVGAVVESCGRAEAADAAGLQDGDVVVEWRHGKASGRVESPFHLAIVEQELAPHGPVSLIVLRDRAHRRVVLPTGRWRIRATPVLSDEVPVRHAAAELLADSGDLAEAARLWAALAADVLGRGEPLVAAWLRIRAGVALARADRPEECLAELNAGSEAITDRRLRAAFWERAGDALLAVGRHAIAAEAFQRSIELLEANHQASPALGFALIQLCRTNLRASAPEATRAIRIYRRLGTDSIEYAQALTTAAVTDYYRSDWEAAQQGYESALRVVRGLVTDSPFECELLGNLGLVHMRRGDLDSAEQLFREEIVIAERLGPDTPQYSHAANYLGLLKKNLGRYEEARLYYEKALSAFQAARPDGMEVAGVLTNLGNVALLEDNLVLADRYHNEALSLRQRLDPDTAEIAASLHSVGLVARWRGDLPAARSSLERALELKESFNPGSAWMANTLFELGEVAREEGDLDEAEAFHREALEILRRVSPRHPQVAISLSALAAVAKERGRNDDAEVLWRDAISIIEQRRAGMRMSAEESARFGSRYYSFYGRLAQLLVDEGREIEAWNVLERARSSALRAVVSGRSSAPAGLSTELWFAKQRLEVEVERIEGRLARLDPVHDPEAHRRYRDQLASSEVRLGRVLEEIRTAAPRYRAISSAEPTTFDELERVLDGGTAVISYSLGEDDGVALVASAGPDHRWEVRTFPIPLGIEELARRVSIFQALIGRGRTVTELEPALVGQGRRLFELLVGPVQDVVEAADRVLIVPDGPLVDLPFAALVLPGEPARFLGHLRPLFFNPSASVFCELRQQRKSRSDGPIGIVAFGDPVYPPASPVTRRHRLQPLPGSRREVRSIGALFGSDASTFLGSSATEARFREAGGRARVLHCAVHAVSDARFPMDSALFFSLQEHAASPGEDGVLSAWEIVDTIETDAEVVVLSACGTARGQAVAGEGIFGLARAFQIAGARTLVASQWAIPDRSTAELMQRHYAGLKQGRSTVEALQVAQRRLAASDPAMEHPFHWASFQVRGDWR
jgi:CHAT domain-containing protein/tetratricopeptide (TPR) repeat protein